MKQAFEKIDGSTSPWDANYTFSNSVYSVLERFVFVDEITNYPSICIVDRGTRIQHVGGGSRIHITKYEIRGFTFSETVEQSGESLAADIEHVIEHSRRWSDPLTEYRLLTVRTDGGVLAPEGVCIVEMEKLKWVS